MDRVLTSKSRRLGRLTKAAAAATLTATAALTLGGSAHAVTYAGGAYNSGTTYTMSDGTNTSSPPTQNLANLAHDMWVASKGVSAAAHFDRGLVSGGSSVAIA